MGERQVSIMAKANTALPEIHRAPALATDMAGLVHQLKGMFSPYRPELHYMRGPGPAWHAKHDRDDVATAEGLVPVLVRVKG
jgi:hypothetical protein